MAHSVCVCTLPRLRAPCAPRSALARRRLSQAPRRDGRLSRPRDRHGRRADAALRNGPPQRARRRLRRALAADPPARGLRRPVDPELVRAVRDPGGGEPHLRDVHLACAGRRQRLADRRLRRRVRRERQAARARRPDGAAERAVGHRARAAQFRTVRRRPARRRLRRWAHQRVPACRPPLDLRGSAAGARREAARGQRDLGASPSGTAAWPGRGTTSTSSRDRTSGGARPSRPCTG
jgi:hypothetical protein